MPLDTMPIFVREDAILPFVEPSQYVGEKPWDPLEIRFFLKKRRFFILMDENRELISVLAKVENDKKTVSLGASGKTFHLKFLAEKRPKNVNIDGQEVTLVTQKLAPNKFPAVWYDQSKREIHIWIEGKSKTHELRFG